MFSTTQLARETGISFRMCDYWCQVGILEPIEDGPRSERGTTAARPGSGSPRRFTASEMWVAAVLAELRLVGAPLDVLRRVASQLRMATEYHGVVFVDPEGWLAREPSPVCWRLDLDSIAALVPAEV